MKHIALLLSLTLTPTFIAPVLSQPTASISSPNFMAARKQTSLAIRAIATPDDAIILAKIGDFENARKLASGMKVQKTYTMQNIARLAAEDAIRSGDYPRAELEIKQAGDVRLWLKLSKRYKQSNRTADARRTAFYAVDQVIRTKNRADWGKVAIWLCELGEQPAARRLFAFAQKELLDPDPFFGSPTDHIYEVAAQYRFDDLIPKTTELFVSMSLVGIYASQNRDEMANRSIENTLAELKQSVEKLPPPKDKSHAINVDQAATMWRVMFYMNMAFYQSQRGDRAATQNTLQEVDSLLKTDNHHTEWLVSKFMLLTYCQCTAQWELVDKVEADIEKYLAESSIPAKDIKQKRERFNHHRLDSFYVIVHPEKFSLEERQTAFARLKQRTIQHTNQYPNEKAQTYLTLARAERSMKDSNWRTSLQSAEDLSVKNMRQRENWYLIQKISTEWREAGEVKKAALLGRQVFDFWKKSSRSKSKPNTKTEKIIKAIDRFAVIDILTNSGLPVEALNLLTSQAEPEELRWPSALTELAKQYPSSPPKQILQLPIPTRRVALRSWAEGLTTQPDNTEIEDSNTRFTFPQFMF